jgi:alpha-L-fucosidase 2
MFLKIKAMNNRHSILIFLLFCNFLVLSEVQAQKTALNDYNISWLTPGINSQGSMPLGNGDIGVNAWVEGNGDLVFYLSKTDAWSENGQLLKLGKIRVSLTPNPYNKGSFSQELKLEQGEIVVNYGLSKIKLWVDANHPTVQVDIESKLAVNAQVSFESWRINRRQIKGSEMPTVYGVMQADKNRKGEAVFQEPDSILSGRKNQIIWCHHNRYAHWSDNLELLSLKEYADKNNDPLLNRTFGALIEASGFVNQSDTVLISQVPSNHFQVNIYPLTQNGSLESWEKALAETANEIHKIPVKVRKNAHIKWWQQFWDRNYIFISSKDTTNRKQVETVTQGYILQRFINACGGRGNFPIKFNGSIFTVDNFNRNDKFKGFDADYRQWGGPYWWQNTRLPYWSMLVSGDFEMMKPLFRMYLNNLPIRKMATRKYYGHDGAFFAETMNFWGTHTNTNYGFDRTGLADGYTTNDYIRYYWQSGLELSLMMLDYYSFTNSDKFANDTLVPMVSEILTFFDQHWKRGSDGKILFSPAMSLETFHTAVNPLPEIVGIRAVAEKMLALPQSFITETQRQQWDKLINDLPEVPTRIVNNETILAPAAKYSNKKNSENPELYAVFPYRTYCIGKPDIELAQRTFAIRAHKENGGWQQNSIQAAYLGLTDEAKRMVSESFSTWDKNFRFPAFWGPNYDWTPDQDHGSVAMIALQRMLIQYENDKIYLLPAWPKEWDVRFKLHAPKNTTVECELRAGKIVKLQVIPASRQKDIEIIGQEIMLPK